VRLEKAPKCFLSHFFSSHFFVDDFDFSKDSLVMIQAPKIELIANTPGPACRLLCRSSQTRYLYSIMKFSLAIITLSLGAVSAFGLSPTTSVTSTIRTNAAFTSRSKALVQPINLDGRMNTEFVSYSTSRSRTRLYCLNVVT